MAIGQIDSKTAFEKMSNDPKSVLLDVRTVEEFVEGHGQGAKNVPIMIRDRASGQMLPNAAFAAVVTKHLAKDAAIFCSCRSGQRSMVAALQLEQLGYTNLFNIKGGFCGSDTTPGWQASQLPVSMENGPGISYESLGEKK